ncbi:MAG TPA: hypothetical protein VF053_18415 [Streptosporangiales bacterium]
MTSEPFDPRRDDGQDAGDEREPTVRPDAGDPALRDAADAAEAEPGADYEPL